MTLQVVSIGTPKLPGRIAIKTSPVVKQLLEEASKLSGVSLTTFILQSALERAEQVFRINQVTKINVTAMRKLSEAIANPAMATPELKALMQEGD